MTYLRGILEGEGRTQSWLAKQVGVDRSVICRYAAGLIPPDDKRQAIADALGRTPDEIWPDMEQAA